jgi:hypothetical protein
MSVTMRRTRELQVSSTLLSGHTHELRFDAEPTFKCCEGYSRRPTNGTFCGVPIGSVVYFKEFPAGTQQIPEVPCISGPLAIAAEESRLEAQTMTATASPQTITDISSQNLILAYVFILFGFFVFGGIFMRLERWRLKEKTA